MCRSIKRLDNFDPPATDEEVYEASLQFVRKISGSKKPSQVNDEVFNKAVHEIENSIHSLLNGLKTTTSPRNREIEAQKNQAKSQARFGTKS